jgi:hypothetical protein
MVTVWFGVGQFLSGAMGQLYPGGDISDKKDGPITLHALSNTTKIEKLGTLRALRISINFNKPYVIR